MRRDIVVSDRQEDQVSEWLQTPESRSAVLHDLEQAVDAFADGIGERAFNKGALSNFMWVDPPYVD